MAGIEKVLVLGASGDQGIPLVSALLNSDVEVVVGARRLDAMQATPYPDLNTVIADIGDVGSLETAFSPIDAVAMHLPFEHDVELAASFGRNIVTAAKTAGLKKSYSIPAVMWPMKTWAWVDTMAAGVSNNQFETQA